MKNRAIVLTSKNTTEDSLDTGIILHWLIRMMNINMETSGTDIYNKSTIKCRYFNVGYCKLKNECPYNHPEIECDHDCTDKTCNNRHKKECINGSNCYYNDNNKCEYLHNNKCEEPKKVNIKKENKILQEKIEELNVMFRKEIDELNLQLKKKEQIINDFNEKYNNLSEIHNKCVKRIEQLEINKKINHKKNNGEVGCLPDIEAAYHAKLIEESILESEGEVKNKIEEKRIELSIQRKILKALVDANNIDIKLIICTTCDTKFTNHDNFSYHYKQCINKNKNKMSLTMNRKLQSYLDTV